MDAETSAVRKITQLLHDYCEIADLCSETQDWQTYGAKWCELFTKDGVFHEGKPFTPSKHGAKVMKELSWRSRGITHMITNVNIKLDPKEKDTAWSDCKFYCWSRPHWDVEDTGKKDSDIWGNYKDKFRLENGEWKFAYRRVQMTAFRGSKPPPMDDGPSRIEFPKSMSSRL